MNDLVLITPPAAEPVSVSDILLQLGMVAPTDDGLANAINQQMLGILAAAREMCETYTRSVYITQTWLLKRDGFPAIDHRYAEHNHHFLLPKLPFQSISSLQYVDVSGVLQPLTQDTSYGTNEAFPMYGYQLDPGSETQPARLFPPWARPWPPTRMVPSNVLLQFKCGFGGPVTGTVAANSVILVGPVFWPGDVGQRVQLPGAGPNAGLLSTSIASVDGNGQATLADPAVASVPATATIWIGRPVPPAILMAIKLAAQFIYTQGGDVDMEPPRIVKLFLDPYRNLVA